MAKKRVENGTATEVVEKNEEAALSNVTPLHPPVLASATPPADISKDPDRIRGRVVVLRDTIDSAYFELSQLVHTIWNGDENGAPMYLQWGFGSFNEYVAKELDFSPRKANYLVAIWDWFGNKVGDSRVIEKVRPLGWTKVKEMVNIVDASNVDEWVAKAKTMGSVAFGDYCKQYLQAKAEQPDQTPNTHTSEENKSVKRMSFGFVGDQSGIVEAALEKAKGIADSDKPGHLLALICQDFTATNDSGEGDREKNVARLLVKYEKLLGIRLIAVDTTEKKILYGADVVKELAAASVAGEDDDADDEDKSQF